MVQHPGGCYFALKEWSGELPSCKGSFAACMHVVFLVPLLAFVSLSSQGACEFFFVFFFSTSFPPGFHSCTEHHAGRSMGREAGSGRRDARVSPDTTACSMPCPPAPGGCLIRSRVRD